MINGLSTKSQYFKRPANLQNESIKKKNWHILDDWIFVQAFSRETFDPAPDKPCIISAEEAYFQQKSARFSPRFEPYVDYLVLGLDDE